MPARRPSRRNAPRESPSILRPSQAPIGRWLRGDLEAEATLRAMCVDRENAPVYAIGSGTDWFQRHPHDVAGDAGLAGIDALAGGVAHGDRAECWLELLAEPDGDLRERRPHHGTGLRLGMFELRMGVAPHGRRQRQQQDDEGDADGLYEGMARAHDQNPAAMPVISR